MIRKFLAIWLLLLLSACLDPLETPGPGWEPQTYEEGHPALSFTARVSNISPGSVRFRNYSTGMKSFTWHFGFADDDGQELTSHTPAPTIKYPRNGRYHVRLKGLGTDTLEYWAYDFVEITNMHD